MKKTKKKQFFLTGNFVCERPKERYEVIGEKEPWIIRVFSFPKNQWDTIGFRKIKDN